jgi:hypothetical protein
MPPLAFNLLDRLLDPLAACLPPEAVDKIVHFQPDESIERRLNELREGANEGTLTETERAEYAEFIEAMDFIALFKAKAAARSTSHGD